MTVKLILSPIVVTFLDIFEFLDDNLKPCHVFLFLSCVRLR